MKITRIIVMYGKSAPSTYVIVIRGSLHMHVYNPCAKHLRMVADFLNNYPHSHQLLTLGKHGLTMSFYFLA